MQFIFLTFEIFCLDNHLLRGENLYKVPYVFVIKLFNRNIACVKLFFEKLMV